ncbi:MAG: SDR family oxidoreductase [Clostridia bacterium]
MQNLKQFSLEGKNAIVTGAGRATGLCYAMAKALHDAGAKIVLMDVSDGVFDLAEEMGGANEGYYGVKANLCDMDSMRAGFGKAMEILGNKLDILINGAGMQYRCDAIEYPADKWRQIIEINLNAVFFLSQMAAEVMIPQGKGKIINVASLTSFNASKRIPAYSASKGAVMQLTKALSNEWAEKGLNINAIAPGYMITEQTTNLVDTEQGRSYTARIPAGRWGYPEDLDGTIVFLASAASDYVTGAIIPVDGGFLGA